MAPRSLMFASLFGTLVLAGSAMGQFSDGSPLSEVPRKPSEGSLSATLDSLLLRELGPTSMAGRIMEFAVYERDPRLFYVATASGGLYKTENGGTSFQPLFQQENSISLGAVAISQTNPDVVYVGTGEQSSRNSVAWGDGMYKSVDGGKTFTHIGLTETRHIGRIVVDPRDPNTVYVAAVGRLWGRSDERGVYKTTDGGKTWSRVLHLGERAGAIDLDMDPKNPDVLYASMWDRLRKPYVFASGGMESGLWKSTDGGKTWRRLTKGMPAGPLGRIGVSIYHKDPRILVATVEYAVPGAPRRVESGEEEEERQQSEDGMTLRVHSPLPFRQGSGGLSTTAAQAPARTPVQAPAQRGERRQGGGAPAGQQPPRDPRMVVPNGSQMNGGGLFISRDSGESWTLLRQLNPRPFYFSTPVIDPNDPMRIYVGGLNILMTMDQGKTWKIVGGGVHADHHAIWIDPRDSKMVLDASDGGVNISHDGARTFEVIQSMAIGQFYSVDFDTQRPYWIYGGLQDNGSWTLPSQSPTGGIGFWDGQKLLDGDGFFVRTDRKRPQIVYVETQAGNILRIDRLTGERVSVRSAMSRAEGLSKDAEGKAEPLRFNWSTPIELGLHGDDVVYVGSHRLLRSTDGGRNFKAISPDLTTNSPRKQATRQIAQRISVNAESTGAENHCTIVTISESPLTKGVIATGSDDGRVNVTTDDGKTWTDVTDNIPGLPADIWCSRVILSKWAPNRMYVTFDNHRYDDFKPYLYVSEDLGKTWSSMSGGLPDYDCLYVIREDTKNPEMLYLGSEMSLRISNDRGKTWSRLRGGFPTVAVHDLQVNDRDGDLIIGTHGRSIWTLDLEPLQNAPTVLGSVTVYPPQDAVWMPFIPVGGWRGDRYFVALNSMPGTLIYYSLASESKEDVKIRILDKDDKVLTTLDGGTKAGLNSVKWNGRASGVPAVIGSYKAEITVGKDKVTVPIQVVEPIRY